MRRAPLAFLGALAVAAASTAQGQMVPFEWSDIDCFEGNYSRIYFDYLNPESTSPGTFHCINDWIVNQDDGGIDGGLNEGEYNLFTFDLGADNYEVLIFRNGTAEIYRNDVLAMGSLENFKSAFSWTTSPNEPDVRHTIWEWSFDVMPTVLRSFAEYDPAGGGWTVYTTPSTPSMITSGPSIYPHYVDGAFADQWTPWTPADDPTRGYQEPIGDPALLPGFNITLQEGGGFQARHIPEPSGFLALAAGLVFIALARRRRR